MPSVILCNLSDANQFIDEARYQWVCDIMEVLGVAEEVYESNNIDAYREKMEELGIEVEMVTNGNVNIYKKRWYKGATEEQSGWLPTKPEDLVAQWKKPTRIMKVDGTETYYEIHLDEWSILNMREK